MLLNIGGAVWKQIGNYILQILLFLIKHIHSCVQNDQFFMKISHTGGRNIFGALSHLQHHLTSSTVDYHTAEVQTEAKKKRSLNWKVTSKASQQLLNRRHKLI